ncbi:Hypp2876 [Branchiostoma lanceolatum]|uniref:Hypp2876 protein n=1 Tax=Branchiostoma lanceolatum TaxID=7740 RepID=A0A8J9ZVF2_BRALA|nr:Hypp2876 [Branchiostoma lanceolatum]
MDQLERIQRRACRIILGRDYPGYAAALTQLGLTTLSERRERLCLKFGRSLLGSQFEHWLPSRRSEISGRCTRNGHKLNIPRANALRFSNSPIPYLTKLLNQYGY